MLAELANLSPETLNLEINLEYFIQNTTNSFQCFRETDLDKK